MRLPCGKNGANIIAMTVDTNILIAYLAGEESVVSFLNEHLQSGRALFLPATVQSELLSFSELTPQEVRAIDAFLSSGFVFVPVDQAVSRLAATIRRTIKIKMPDATIAATALLTNSPLLTRNVKDFKDVPRLAVLTV